MEKKFFRFNIDMQLHFCIQPSVLHKCNVVSPCLGSVHLACADGHRASGSTGKRQCPVHGSADVTETNRPRHQHPSAGDRQGADYSVSTSRIHQVRKQTLTQPCLLYGFKTSSIFTRLLHY